MDRYEVELLEKAYRDLDDIYTYIASEFLAPETARKQLNRLKEAILGLAAFPNSHQDRLVGFYANKGYKQLLIDNYIAIFRVDEDKKKVYVITIQYVGRDL